MRHTVFLLLAFALVHPAITWAGVSQAQLNKLRLPQGFAINVLTDQVPNARQLALAEGGTLFIGTRSKGKVYAVVDALAASDANRSPKVLTIASGLTLPSGLVMHGKDLLVGAVNKVLRFAQAEKNLAPDMPFEVITDRLPDKRHHGWKYLSLGPDGQLYVPVGAPCNICESDDPRFASILRMEPDTGATSLYASGIRNTVGLAWHPTTGQLWFSDNGRDMLGDDVPAEEINRVTSAGQHFGYPYIHAEGVVDPKFGQGKDPATYVAPAATIQAHSAALGIAFYTGKQFPDQFSNALFIAEHGSWNRSSKVGYRVSVMVNTSGRVQPFINGWLQGQDAWGRPNDVLVAPDGSLLISDDQAGAVYRVSYQTAEAGRE